LCRLYLDQEISTIDPALVIPIGRLAINLYYPANLSLTGVIGTQKQVNGRWIVPLPHPSGASRWHQIEANRTLVDQAIVLIRDHYQRIFQPADT
jgi:uracil-DNA glycosylase